MDKHDTLYVMGFEFTRDVILHVRLETKGK